MVVDYLTRTWRTLLASLVVCLIVGTSAYIKGRSDQSKIHAAERAAANVIAITTARNADEVAAVDRVGTALTIAKQKDELTNAIASTPDTAPDAVRVALGCERLRQAGTPDAAVPAICGSAGAGGGQASARP